jgi:hypothetical protein
MKLLIPLLILLTLACNPVKKVINSESKTIKVVEHYLKTHPFKNDTVTNVIKGDTITDIRIDTITEPYYDTDSFYVDRYHTITKTITKRRVDTLVRVITDKSFINALQRSNDVKDAQIKHEKEQVKAIGKKADKWKYRTISLLFLLLAYGGYKLYKFLKPSVRIG